MLCHVLFSKVLLKLPHVAFVDENSRPLRSRVNKWVSTRVPVPASTLLVLPALCKKRTLDKRGVVNQRLWGNSNSANCTESTSTYFILMESAICTRVFGMDDHMSKIGTIGKGQLTPSKGFLVELNTTIYDAL